MTREQIIEAIKAMTVLELNELVKACEEEFGVSAAAPVAVVGAAGAAAAEEEVKMPPKEVVTAQIPGVEVMDLDDAVKCLWKVGIYAESGMGCTGPIVLMSEANKAKAAEELKKAGYIG